MLIIIVTMTIIMIINSSNHKNNSKISGPFVGGVGTMSNGKLQLGPGRAPGGSKEERLNTSQYPYQHHDPICPILAKVPSYTSDMSQQ